MITAPVKARFAFSGRRLDAQYFCSPGARANEALVLLQAAGIEVRAIGGPDGLGTVFHPSRFKRQLAAPAEESLPFLRAFDVFEYLPQPADLISVPRTERVEMLTVEPGTILLTRSGRNLGPAVMTDDYLCRFIPSDDLLRIRIDDGELRYYVLAFLNSSVGQALLRQDKTGSVIDHISAGQVTQQGVPLLTDVIESAARFMRRCVELRSSARQRLAAAIEAIDEAADLPPTSALRDGWTVRASTFNGRLDASFYQERIAQLRRHLLANGGMVLGDLATVRKPAGRYKTYYVAPEHGKPLLSGRNLLQVTPIAPKYISPRSIPDADKYQISPGWLCFQADGRAEEHLGFPVMVTPDRAGWLASSHVGRVIPNEENRAGALWAAMASTAVQEQLAAVACGSVVDALYEEDVFAVVLPPMHVVETANVRAAWDDFAEAAVAERVAISQIENAIAVQTEA